MLRRNLYFHRPSTWPHQGRRSLCRWGRWTPWRACAAGCTPGRCSRRCTARRPSPAWSPGLTPHQTEKGRVINSSCDQCEGLINMDETELGFQTLKIHLLRAVPFEQGEGSSERWCKVSNLHRINLVHCLRELGNVLRGRLNQFRLPVRVGEALDQRLRLVGECEDGDEIVFAERLHDVEHHVLRNLLPQACHWSRHVEQDDNILCRKESDEGCWQFVQIKELERSQGALLSAFNYQMSSDCLNMFSSVVCAINSAFITGTSLK